MFLLATALGTGGEVLGVSREIVEAVKQCVASAEVVFLSCREHRPYTAAELAMIFKDQAMLFFGGVAKVTKYADEQVRRGRVVLCGGCMTSREALSRCTLEKHSREALSRSTLERDALSRYTLESVSHICACLPSIGSPPECSTCCTER